MDRDERFRHLDDRYMRILRNGPRRLVLVAIVAFVYLGVVLVNLGMAIAEHDYGNVLLFGLMAGAMLLVVLFAAMQGRAIARRIRDRDARESADLLSAAAVCSGSSGDVQTSSEGIEEASQAPIDITAPEIAERVHAIANAKFYQILLAAVQAEAAKLGYSLVKGGSPLTDLPAFVMQRLRFALVLARRTEFWPYDEPDDIKDAAGAEVYDGYAATWWRNIAESLSDMGVGFHVSAEVAEDAPTSMVESAWREHCATALVEAAQLRVKYGRPDASAAERQKKVEEYLSRTDDAYNRKQLSYQLSHVYGGGEKYGWTDKEGRVTDQAPDITEKLRIVEFADDKEMKAVIAIALQTFRESAVQEVVAVAA